MKSLRAESIRMCFFTGYQNPVSPAVPTLPAYPTASSVNPRTAWRRHTASRWVHDDWAEPRVSGKKWLDFVGGKLGVIPELELG